MKANKNKNSSVSTAGMQNSPPKIDWISTPATSIQSTGTFARTVVTDLKRKLPKLNMKLSVITRGMAKIIISEDDLLAGIMRSRFLNNDFALPPSRQFLHAPPISSGHSTLPVSQIAAALSTFPSSVLPHKIHLKLFDRNPQQESEASFEEDGRQSCRNFCSKAETEFPKETKRTDCSDKCTPARCTIGQSLLP
ncbi:uncharacterized protein LOC130979022 [Arachis stenosperma]|uniref:uncharacterized protein LOC130978963 n=1 Tax=Arachis stenosperma TaxID=217475 RepID=UPI0025AC4FE8|nr:uncharacterized protein LOC130978963 [Arachis stenosperma]XP_057758348.1 uncharacterized protein LOC130979022 [Arachis stenosperma]